ncbi:N-acetylmuramoyl-L-alanine amidase family protein [Natranaerobius trueperi]|uniref:MurNAc-LAA domain-containing protein n=1 Tax=Natranaerobius trueperi TaxID=759412 RepID=A0A226C152_9FIRM|nr:N-acetylmuramoyl-L-alanine amidase [Natranaerobius trueperi]OWZ84911.1 hypothetical protein CDO51_00460 [Natranaerobius trueperi]
MVLVTNLWSSVSHPNNSIVGVDFYPDLTNFEVSRLDSLRYNITFQNASLNFPPTSIFPLDGLVDNVELSQNKDHIELYVTLTHPTNIDYKTIGKCPEQVKLYFDRTPLVNLLKNKHIVIDPSHGGSDYGSISPTSLLEKEVTLDLAYRSKELLEKYQAYVTLLRTSDKDPLPTRKKQNKITSINPDLMISLHTGNDVKGKVIGSRTGFFKTSSQGKKIANIMQKALYKKLIFPNGGIFKTNVSLLKTLPDKSIRVEILNITSRLEEGWMRDDGFRDIMVQGLFNGIKDIFNYSTT